MTKLTNIVFGLFALVLLPALGWAASPWGQGGLPGELKACEAELEACLELPCATFPGDGQTGELLAYEDNLDGTFTDLNTGMIWEIKLADTDPVCVALDQEDRDVHCVNNAYTWSESGIDADGTAFTEFLADLNATEFAGYNDWRLPTPKELQSLVDYSEYFPAVRKVLPNPLPGATAPQPHWTSAFDTVQDFYAWNVCFGSGTVSFDGKWHEGRVRAVRSP